MRGFDALDPNLNLKRHVFLEASAGTGKTFAIEKLATRFLLEPDGPDISQILIVTFTKAAAAELRERLRINLERSLKINGDKKIKKALAAFEEAAIYTIHGFCFHTLQEHILEGRF